MRQPLCSLLRIGLAGRQHISTLGINAKGSRKFAIFAPQQSRSLEKTVERLKKQAIPVFQPQEREYEHLIATSNLLYRFSRPNCVIQPENATQVQAIINEARSEKLKVTIKCNGHSYAGHSTAFDGISLDLRRMQGVSLNARDMTVDIDAGCQWGHVYGKLIDGRHDGLIINGGRCPTVGVSGFMLGGGLGPFTRSFGMGCDTMMEATVVTADGKLVTVGEKDDPQSKEGRLFWALRGAGGGNFGVMVKMKLKVQKLKNRHGMVVAGRHQWFPEGGFDNNEFMKTMNDFYLTDWPKNITVDSTWICDLRDKGNLDGVRFTISFDGSKGEYDRLIEKHIKSTRFLYETLVNQWMEETERAYPTNKTYELYSSFVFTNNDKATIEKVTAEIRDLMAEFRELFKGEKVNFLVTWIHAGGRATEFEPTQTAYFWRQAVFHTYVTIEWVDKWMELDMRKFLGKIKKRLRPHSLGGKAAFINFPDRDFPLRTHEAMYFGDNRDELRRVKEMWDPKNFFKWDQGVKLPQTASQDRNAAEGEDGVDDEGRTDSVAGEQWDYFKPKDVIEELDELADMGF
ncbi:hypothetical protein QC764_0025200 [Podospora pseudoanserina]|uniref:FAD-binding PCMH-type domain-containing protein n=1 Tax=Podospora pseudoanserina TaxID=2609844 RepID=A0ABR0IRL3_9PEZI|nr:hypothetical protein QC764_0025200 [Podospora pseudoanserina]